MSWAETNLESKLAKRMYGKKPTQYDVWYLDAFCSPSAAMTLSIKMMLIPSQSGKGEMVFSGIERLIYIYIIVGICVSIRPSVCLSVYMLHLKLFQHERVKYHVNIRTLTYLKCKQNLLKKFAFHFVNMNIKLDRWVYRKMNIERERERERI